MLLEAARQTKDYPHLRSCTVKFVGLTFVDTDLKIKSDHERGQTEIILNFRLNDDELTFQIEILITSDELDTSWKKCCTADLQFIASKQSLVQKLRTLVEHDEALIEQIQSLRSSLIQGMQNLQLERNSAKRHMNQRN